MDFQSRCMFFQRILSSGGGLADGVFSKDSGLSNGFLVQVYLMGFVFRFRFIQWVIS